jgi:formylglycine-generating enzyme required for sulfatase activity
LAESGNVTISWDESDTGLAELEFSPDLSEWTVISGTNMPNPHVHYIGNANRGFYRLRLMTIPPAPVKASMIAVQSGTLPQISELAGTNVGTFMIGKYEVTWHDWRNVRDWAVRNGYDDLANVGEGSAVNHPVRNVSWYDAVKWINAKSEKDGLSPVYHSNGDVYRTGDFFPSIESLANGYRLPTEAEWEWAARGGVASQGYTYSGSNDPDAVGWYLNSSSGAAVNLFNVQGTWPVGQKGANELGIHDMSGNVWEWCEDLFYDHYRRLRGGSWRDYPTYIGFRGYLYYPNDQFNDFGFRLARSIDETNMVFIQGGRLPQISQFAGTSVASFQIGKYEVTWAEWQEVRDWAVSNGYSDLANVGAGSAVNHPVRNVSWYDAVKWLNAKSEMEGWMPAYTVNGTIYRAGDFESRGASLVTRNATTNGYRLPSAAEWEWAARGGVSSQGYPYSGSNKLHAVGWYRDNSSGAAVGLFDGQGTLPVGQKGANELGIHDMSGNVWEWCENGDGIFRYFRGGAFNSSDFECTVNLLDGYFPNYRAPEKGFRLARSAP